MCVFLEIKCKQNKFLNQNFQTRFSFDTPIVNPQDRMKTFLSFALKCPALATISFAKRNSVPPIFSKSYQDTQRSTWVAGKGGGGGGDLKTSAGR